MGIIAGGAAVEIEEVVHVKTAQNDDQRKTRHSGVVYRRGRVVYVNRRHGWVCMDFGHYRACAYIRDILGNAVVVV